MSESHDDFFRKRCARCFPFEPQIVTGAFDRQQFRPCRNHLQRALKFLNRPEGIAGALNEQRWRSQVWEMLRPLLLGPARRMQRIGQQQQSRNQVWGVMGKLGAEHAGLASAIGVSAEIDVSRRFAAFVPRRVIRVPTLSRQRTPGWGIHHSPECGNRVLQAGAVARGVARSRWPEGSRLAKGKIAAEHAEPGFGEGVSQCAGPWGLCTAACAVCQDKAAPVGCLGDVQKSADWRIHAVVGKFADGDVGQDNILNPKRTKPNHAARDGRLSPVMHPPNVQQRLLERDVDISPASGKSR